VVCEIHKPRFYVPLIDHDPLGDHMHPTSIFLAAVSIICTTGPVLAQDQQVKSDFNLTVVVPLDVTDLTDDVFGIEIGCLAYSSLLGEDNNIVGAVGQLPDYT
jgi:hypothetical protein